MLFQTTETFKSRQHFASLQRPTVRFNHTLTNKSRSQTKLHKITSKPDLHFFVKYPILCRNPGEKSSTTLLNLLLFIPRNTHITFFIIVARTLQALKECRFQGHSSQCYICFNSACYFCLTLCKWNWGYMRIFPSARPWQTEIST